MPRRTTTTAHDIDPPSNWPPEVTYIVRQRYARDVTPALRDIIQSLGVARIPPGQPCKLVKIQTITDAKHPAHGQRGLFAAAKLPPRTHVLDYFGEVHVDERPESDYDLMLMASGREDRSVGVDAQFMGNEARFVNDYRGTGAKRANVEFRERVVEGELRMAVWSGSEEIKRGTELVVSYGKGWWEARQGKAGLEWAKEADERDDNAQSAETDAMM